MLLLRPWPIPLLVVVVATACGGDKARSEREIAATRLVAARVGQSLTCRDNGAVNIELHPEYAVGYTCVTDDDETYLAVVAPDGRLTSVRGPYRLRPAGS